jgi:hypothetical protein
MFPDGDDDRRADHRLALAPPHGVKRCHREEEVGGQRGREALSWILAAPAEALLSSIAPQLIERPKREIVDDPLMQVRLFSGRIPQPPARP